MTYEVQQTRWDRIIRRVSGSIGPGSRVSETISELFPVLDIERVPGELLILGGTDICAGAATSLGAVGEVGLVQLFNPTDSGNIITVTRITLSCTTTTVLRWALTTTALGTNELTERFRDTRRGVLDLPVGKIRTDSRVALVLETQIIRVVANSSHIVEDPNGVAVLAPGSGLDIGPTTTNVNIQISFLWRERPADQAELQF